MKIKLLRSKSKKYLFALSSLIQLGAIPFFAGSGLDDAEPLVRGHAAWALGQIGSDASRAALIARSDIEVDAWVAQELSAARL